MRAHLRLRLLLLPLLLWGCLAGATRATVPALVIVSSERSAVYEAAAQAAIDELVQPGAVGPAVAQFTADEFVAQREVAARLFLALGTEACAVLARSEPRGPVLCTLLPQASFERVLRQSGRRAGTQFSALFLNQPLNRQLELMRLALPQARRIGVLWGPDSQWQEAMLESAARSRGLRVIGARPGQTATVYGELKEILDESDLLLALADPQIYNSRSIQNILLASFRAQVPMLAFSPAYVRAGALLAVYSTPEQIGRQAGQLARAVLQGQPLLLPQYPRYFEVGVNEHVARSLGLTLDAKSLALRLRRQERGS
jgi:ABC-type uncharacterized transport system substrate-binding protein